MVDLIFSDLSIFNKTITYNIIDNLEITDLESYTTNNDLKIDKITDIDTSKKIIYNEKSV